MTTTKENGMDKQDAAAEAIAAYIEDDANGAKIWRGDGGQVRVYVTRTLSRGRRQDMGFVSVAADGTASVAGMVRRKAAVRGWVDAALAGA